jgi:hypothetical protein
MPRSYVRCSPPIPAGRLSSVQVKISLRIVQGTDGKFRCLIGVLGVHLTMDLFGAQWLIWFLVGMGLAFLELFMTSYRSSHPGIRKCPEPMPIPKLYPD